ncbi:hypothetical protein N665_0140s0006 [Sinapis alba]|nr:hypothetical protein N665_0140s0006 [Sinapis alba]
MQPLKLHFPSSQYQKSLKLSGKCYIDTALRIYKDLEREGEHPQFQHFFHIKNRKQKWMGMWLLILRSACVAKKYELWFIVNGVPIRNTLREFRLFSRLYCHEYPPNHERLGGTTFMNKYFEGKRKQMLAVKLKPHQDRLKMAVMYFLASILVGVRKSGEGASPLLAFKVIPSLRNHLRETVNGARSGCPRMCKMQYKRKGGTKSYSLNAMNRKLGETKAINFLCVFELRRN